MHYYTPDFVIPRGLSTLYRCSLTAVAQCILLKHYFKHYFKRNTILWMLWNCWGSNVGPSEQFSHSVVYMYFFPTKCSMSYKLNKYKNTDEMAQCFFKNNEKSVIFTQLYIIIISVHQHKIFTTGFNRPFQHSQHVRIQYDVMVIVHENWIHASNIVHKDKNSYREPMESKIRNLFFTSIFSEELCNCVFFSDFWFQIAQFGLTCESIKAANNAKNSVPYDDLKR